MTQVLVVDDDRDYAGALRMVLQSRGFDVAMMHDTARVLDRLDQRLPDALILDVMFPEDPTAGIELAQTVRHRYPSLPIIMLTAINQNMPLGLDRLDMDAAMLAVTDFVEKPVDFRLMCDKLDRLLHRPTFATAR
jgi:DNA-binding response OmpR family regulator